jgi:hypothetical protein
MLDVLPRVVAHADWSMHPGKRWLARAILQPSGSYLALAPEPVGALEDLFARLAGGGSGDGAVLLGVDFPIGLPKAYAKCAGIDDFVEHLAQFDDHFYAVARQPSEICITRPFYPYSAGKKGTVSRRQLLEASPWSVRVGCTGAASSSRTLRPCSGRSERSRSAGRRSAAGATCWRRRCAIGWTLRSGRFKVRSPGCWPSTAMWSPRPIPQRSTGI